MTGMFKYSSDTGDLLCGVPDRARDKFNDTRNAIVNVTQEGREGKLQVLLVLAAELQISRFPGKDREPVEQFGRK